MHLGADRGRLAGERQEFGIQTRAQALRSLEGAQGHDRCCKWIIDRRKQ